MEDGFFITEMYICTFSKVGELLKPNINEYPMRFCVLDDVSKIAIDIESGLKYDYVETMSMLYFINNSYLKIKDNKRVAVFPTKLIDIEPNIKNEAHKIIAKLKNGVEFNDGNEVLDNENYLKSVTKKQKEKVKVKKI